MTIYSLNVLLPRYGTGPLFHVWFYLLLLDLHTGFSRGKCGGLVFPSLSEFPRFVVIHTVKTLVNDAVDVFFLEFSCFFYDPVDIGNLISGSSAFSKSQLEHLELHSSRTVEAWLGEF